MTFRPVFQTGSMPGLINIFSRHYGFMTNFSILLMESRLYWLRGGYLSARSPGVRRARGPECLGGRRNACLGTGWVLAMVGPWQYQCTRLDQYPGIPPSRYPPSLHHPGTPPPRTHPVPHTMYANVTTATPVLASTKEILGVDNAPVHPRAR